MSSFVNIAGYKFVRLDQLAERREAFREECRRLNVKGTILLSQEGINLFLAATRPEIDEFLTVLRSESCFEDFSVKESLSDEQPFNRLLVRIKKEIIAFGVAGIDPAHRTSPKLAPQELKKWLDEGKPVTLLDVRNNYEIELGTFKNAVNIDIDHFKQFPDAVQQLPEETRRQPIVMFCTGGIRCEKAGPFMENAGFESVFQLDGGILQYFEDCGSKHYDGDCFVFDQRVAVNSELEETDAEFCFACQHVLLPEDLKSEKYVIEESCPYCYKTPAQQLTDLIDRRHEQIDIATNPLPGSVPYDNIRPINVPKRFDRWQLLDFLCAYHPHIERESWVSKIESGKMLYQSRPLTASSVIRSGQRIEHLLPATTEPDVNPQIRVLYEDDAIVVVNKPAPLPMHASGRFNRNTLSYILDHVYPHPLRITHRLDANTTGVLVIAKTSKVAALLHPQFERKTVQKTYLARVHGHPDSDEFVVDFSLTDRPATAGGRRTEWGGKECLTQFKTLNRCEDGSSLLEARPQTGRTNQIRIHLWKSGLPIVGDPTYLPNGEMADKQTLAVDDDPMCLHACQIGFRHPQTGRQVCFEAELPGWAKSTVAAH